VQKTRTPPPATATPTVSAPHVARTFRHVSDRPNSVALVRGRLWITSRYVPLLRMDAQTGGRRERDESVPPGGIAISRHGNRVWVSNRRRHFVVELHARSHRVLLRLPQPGPPAAIAADGSGGVWVAIRGPLNEPPDTLIHYDATGRTLWQKDVRQGITAIVLSPRALWVALTKVPRLMAVDRRTGRTRTVPVINQAGFLTYGGGYVWASAPFDGSVTRVEPRTGRAASAAAGQHPAQLAYTAGRLFVACVNDRTLAVIDPRSLRRVKQIPMPLNPYGVTADSGHVWVTSLGEDTVTRVDVH
jgi:DNA-binding beta-propeller fold protein YncE